MEYRVFENDKYPMINLEQILKFINYYDLILSYKKEDLILRGEWFTFGRKDYLELFEILMILHMENVITLRIYEVGNNNGRLNKELVNELNNCKGSEGLVGSSIFSNKNNFDGNYIVWDVLNDWDTIKDKIKKYDGLDISVEIKGSSFLNLFFRKITEFMGYNNIDKADIGKILYKNIIEQTGGKLNHLGKIELFYRFEEDYLKQKRLILPLLVELERKGNLSISNIKIDGEYIYFELDKVLDISEYLFINTSIDIKFEGEKQDIKKIEYTKDGIKINSNKWIPIDSQKSEVFLRIISNYFYENIEEKEITVNRFNTYYLENRDELLYDIDKEKRLKYLTLSEKNITNSYITTINKKILEEYTEDLLQIGRGLIKRKKVSSK